MLRIRLAFPRAAAAALAVFVAGAPSLAPTAQAQLPCDEAVLIRTSHPGEPFQPLVAELEGDRVLVGAFASSSQLVGQGAVFVFDRDPVTGQWSETQELLPSVPVRNMGFGTSLHLDGDLAIVGAGLLIDPAYPGLVNVYMRDAATGVWSETQSLRPMGTTDFARATAYRDGHLAVADRLSTLSGRPRIHLYRFEGATQRFAFDGIIDGRPGPANEQFAQSLAYLDSDTLAVSDPQAEVNGLPFAGATHVYRRVGTTTGWGLAQTLVAETPEAGEGFGFVEGAVGSRLFVRGDEPISVPLFSARYNVEYAPGPDGALVEVSRIAPDPAVVGGTPFLLGVPEADVALAREFTRPSPSELITKIRRWIRDSASGEWYASTTLESWEGQSPPLRLNSISRDGDRAAFIRQVDPVVGPTFSYVAIVNLVECQASGFAYCAPGVANSTGRAATLEAHLDPSDPDADIMLLARHLPPGVAALALVSDMAGATPLTSSLGPLCLGGTVGRHPATLVSSAAGTVGVRLQRSALPVGAGVVAAASGSTWHFQLWYRDLSATATSNTSTARTVLFF